MARKGTQTKKSETGLGDVVMVYTKSSSHWYALVQPQIVVIEGLKFLQGTQVTGKEGHRMERKRTLIPFDHVASIVEFASEDDLWSDPQPRHLRLPEETRQSTVLTSHEQSQQPSNQGAQHRHRRRHQGRHKRHDRFPEQHDPRDPGY